MSWSNRIGKWTPTTITVQFVGKFLAAVIVGASIATLLPPEPVTLPAIGSVPGLAVGGVGLVLGLTLYTQIPDSSGCSCSGDCNC